MAALSALPGLETGLASRIVALPPAKYAGQCSSPTVCSVEWSLFGSPVLAKLIQYLVVRVGVRVRCLMEWVAMLLSSSSAYVQIGSDPVACAWALWVPGAV